MRESRWPPFFHTGAPVLPRAGAPVFAYAPSAWGCMGPGQACAVQSAKPRSPRPLNSHLPGFPPPGSQTVANGLAAQGRDQGQRDIISLDMEAYQTFVFGSKSCGGQQWPETKGLRTPKCPIRLFCESYVIVFSRHLVLGGGRKIPCVLLLY